MDINTKNSGEITLKISSLLKSIFKGSNLFILAGIILQCYAFSGSWLSLISGVAGVIGVVWVSQKKVKAYVPCFIQLGTYLLLAFQEKLWGEVGENIFYLATMLVGVVLWYRNSGAGLVFPRALTKKALGLVTLGTTLGILILWGILRQTNDSQPALDALTTVPAVVAQILMILRYREQWIFWLIIDVGSIVMWWNAGNTCMVAQFCFWTINCLYGLWKWKK